MSIEPSATSSPLSSWISRRRRCAIGTPRVWMPTRATWSRSGFPSMISCAIRVRLFAIDASSRSVFGLVCAGSGNRSPFRPHGTELKDVERAGDYKGRRTTARFGGARRAVYRGLDVRDDVVGVGQRLDRVSRLVERRLRDEHLLRRVVGLCRVVVNGRLELRLDSRGLQDRLELLRFRDVAGDGYLNHPRHRTGTSTPSLQGGFAPARTSSGNPRSWNGTTMISRSRGTTVSGKIAWASRSISPPKYRFDRCVRTRRPTSARRATSAASVAVEWSVSCARSRSSSANVASWTRRSAPRAASTTLRA